MLILDCNFEPVDIGRPFLRLGWLAVTKAHDNDHWDYTVTDYASGAKLAGFYVLVDAKKCARQVLERVKNPVDDLDLWEAAHDAVGEIAGDLGSAWDLSWCSFSTRLGHSYRRATATLKTAREGGNVNQPRKEAAEET